MQQMGECVKADVEDVAAIADHAQERGVDLTVVGPGGAAGRRARGLLRGARAASAFGPGRTRRGSRAASSSRRASWRSTAIPTGRARLFEDFDEAKAYVESTGAPLVVKADGLAAGKGVIIAYTTDEAVAGAQRLPRRRGVRSSRARSVLVEEFLEGPEVSILSLTDGDSVAHMVPSQDHKRAFDGDEGPNTGGMGAYSPVPLLDAATERARSTSR